MKRHLILIPLLALTISCGGYSDSSSPLSEEQVQIADMATALMNDAAALQESAPAEFKEYAGDLSDATVRFQNLCHRMGANSLEARKAFDKIMFVEAQITRSPDLEKQPEFNTRWQELRKGRLKEMAEKLGYRPEKLN